MTSPLEQMITSAVRCTKCGAKFGECNCWLRCPKCQCMYETGGQCGRCKGEPLKVIASGTLSLGKHPKEPQWREMVERVARAICIEDGNDPDADWRATEYPGGAVLMLDVIDDEPQMWRQYVKKARAAIAAMREPSKEMCEAAENADVLDWSLEPGEGLDGVNYDNAWRAMIDAALK